MGKHSSNVLNCTRRTALRLPAFWAALWPPRSLASSKTFIVGSTATGVPFSFIDVKTNTLTGAMVDLVKAIAQDAGFQIELLTTGFGALIPSLTARKIDIIAAAMLKTPARAKAVDFSEPVYSYGGGIVIPAGVQRKYPTIEDLRGLTVGAQVGTRFFEQLQAAGVKEIKTYDNLMEMLGDLSVGRIGAAYGDTPIFAYQIAQLKIKSARLAQEFRPPTVEDVCLVVRKGDTELLNRINTSVQRLRSTVIKVILNRWGLH